MAFEASWVRRRRLFDFLVFCCCAITILYVTYRRGVFLVAPPYDVTAYLVLAEKNTRFSKMPAVVVSYAFVIATTVALHELLGETLFSLAVNVLVVSAFIFFTRFSHPPSIALTIFSYLTKDLLGFAATSTLVLVIIFLFSITAKMLEGRISGRLPRNSEA